MSFPRYERYKDSGVEWLGEVPEHWEVTRVKTVLAEVDCRAEETPLELLSLSKARGVLPRRLSEQNASVSDNYGKYKIALSGQLVMNKMQAWNGVFGLCSTDGMVSPDYAVFRIFDVSHSAFLCELFRTEVMAGEFFRACRGMGTAFLRLNTGDFFDVRIPLPPSQEVKAISGFLEVETAKIDALIEEQRRLIELLKEKRQAVISHAVTNHLHSKNKREPNFRRLRHYVLRIEQGWSPVAEDRDPDSGQWAVLKLSAVKRGGFDGTKVKALAPGSDIPYALELQHGDFLVTRANTPELVGDCCCVSEPPPHTIFSDLIYRIVLNKAAMSPHFLNLVVQSAFGRSQAKRDARGSSQSMVKLSHEHILNWLIPSPSLQEQLGIVTVAKAALEELVRASEVCRDAIDLLQERRSALISAAVTGKIDVRNYTPKEAA